MSAQVLIHSRERNAYRTADGRWSRQIMEGRVFTAAREADEYCRRENLSNVELLVLREGQPLLRIPLRVSAAPPVEEPPRDR